MTDVNDNQPKFTQRSYSGGRYYMYGVGDSVVTSCLPAEVSVTASPGTSVLTVAATDEDSESYGEVSL